MLPRRRTVLSPAKVDALRYYARQHDRRPASVTTIRALLRADLIDVENVGGRDGFSLTAYGWRWLTEEDQDVAAAMERTGK